MELHIKIVGWLLILLALLHVVFPHFFKWKEEFGMVSHINRQMMYVHTFFIAITVLLMGLLCITSARELVATTIGRKVSAGLGIFWAIRLFVQFFGYSSSLWRGKAFETSVHIVFSILWIYISAVFFYPFFS